MKSTFLKAILMALIIGGWNQTASAVVPVSPLTVGGGWFIFDAGAQGSGWDRAYSFSLAGPAMLTVTDAFLSGDRYEVVDLNLGTIGLTSIPTSTGDNIGNNFDAAVADPRWSTGKVILGAGDYTITGSVHTSPFTASGGGLRVDLTGIPEPTTSLMMGLALAGLGLLKLKNRRQ